MSPPTSAAALVSTPFVAPDDINTAQAAVRRVEREASQADRRHATEFNDKRRCTELENAVHGDQTSELTTAKTKRLRLAQRISITVGEYVRISPDLTPGKCSHGGTGYVIACSPSSDDAASTSFTVKYDECTGTTTTEKDIPVTRLTVLPIPAHRARQQRETSRTTSFGSEATAMSSTKQPAVLTLTEKLVHACRHNRKKGWRRDELGYSEKDKRKNDFFQSVLADYNYLKGYHDATPDVIHHMQRAGDGTWKTRAKQHNPYSLTYLLTVGWGVGHHYVTEKLRKQREPKQPPRSNPTRSSVIDDPRAFALRNSAKKLFISDALSKHSDRMLPSSTSVRQLVKRRSGIGNHKLLRCHT
jgi:hypothetical protein